MQLEVDIARKAFTNAAGERHDVLADFNFALGAGEVAVFVGPSGCGKTTMLKIVAGLDHDYQGRVACPASARVGMVFQEPRLLPWRSVDDNVRLAAPKASDEKLSALFAVLELTAHRNHFPGPFSRRTIPRPRPAGRARPCVRDRAGFPHPRRTASIARRRPCRPPTRPDSHVGGQPIRDDTARHPRHGRCDSPRRQGVSAVATTGADSRRTANSHTTQRARRSRDRCDQSRDRTADQWRLREGRCLIGSACVAC